VLFSADGCGRRQVGAVEEQPGQLREHIAGILRGRTAQQVTASGFRRAAVLVPLYEGPTGPHLLLVRRTDSVPTHKGQVGFPGGGFQEEDGELLATALREAREELGLQPEDVEILGVLDDTLAASSQHVVRPFVGSVPYAYAFRPDPFEVQALIHLPIGPLLRGAPFREEMWERDGRPFPVYFYEQNGHLIWGLTARILKQLVDLVGPSLRLKGLPDPPASNRPEGE
jgi:8-oxo-dGTP pyrophosphatase MutT (NUDIX family)